MTFSIFNERTVSYHRTNMTCTYYHTYPVLPSRTSKLLHCFFCSIDTLRSYSFHHLHTSTLYPTQKTCKTQQYFSHSQERIHGMLALQTEQAQTFIISGIAHKKKCCCRWARAASAPYSHFPQSTHKEDCMCNNTDK